MFCLMDVSSSMDEKRKDLAKRFFTLLYLFLTRKYKKVDLVFIRHTDQAQEVDEDTFFNGTQAGSTKVLSALAKMNSTTSSALRRATGTPSAVIRPNPAPICCHDSFLVRVTSCTRRWESDRYKARPACGPPIARSRATTLTWRR